MFLTILVSFSAALLLRVSCTKRKTPDKRTIVRMTTIVMKSCSPVDGKTTSVTKDTAASTVNIAVNGLMNASASRLGNDLCLPVSTRLLPQSSRFLSTVSGLAMPSQPEW